jgi:tetratricopeptide (TPR) repeat protein
MVGFQACHKNGKETLPALAPDFKKGESFLYQQNDSAFYYFNKVATSSKDSLEIAMAYNYMSVIQSYAGDYYGGQEGLLISLKYLNEQKEQDQYCLSSDYNELGRSSTELKNYEASIEYYDQALKLAKKEGFRLIVLNNKAVTYQKLGQYAQAIDIYRSVIDKSRGNRKEYARILSNLARVRWLEDPEYLAAPDLLKAMQIRKEEKDNWGLNASYSHLADYYIHIRPDSALFYANKMYSIAQQLSSPDDQLEALEKLIVLSPPRNIKQYFTRYRFLNDSIQTVRNASKNQFALIRYEAQKNKADNLRLQKDNTEKKVQIIQQQGAIYGIIVLFISIVFLIVTWYRKRKRRLEWEARERELRTSQKVHDVVANGLYRLMNEIEHQNTLEKEPLLNKLDDLYERSRDISHDSIARKRTDFQLTIAELLTSFAGENTKIFVVGNDEDTWRSMKDQLKNELEHILLELMVNMKKHSSARNVVVRFERLGNCLKVNYMDDGIGLPLLFQYKNRLINTENRIKSIDGRISFDRTAIKGLKIQIEIPIV